MRLTLKTEDALGLIFIAIVKNHSVLLTRKALSRLVPETHLGNNPG